MKKLFLLLAGILVLLAGCSSPLDEIATDSAQLAADEAANRATTTGPKPPAAPSTDAADPGSAVYPFTSYQTLKWTTAVEKRPVEAYIPTGVVGKVPVIVWMGGFKMQATSFYKATLEHIAKKGIVMVFVAADTGAMVLGDADHVKPARAINEAAKEALAKIPSADADNLYYIGHSLGAKCSVIAAALATTLDTANVLQDPKGLILFAFANTNGGPFATKPDNNNPANGYAAKVGSAVSATIVEYEDDTIAGPKTGFSTGLYAKIPSTVKQHILIGGSRFKLSPALSANHNTALTAGSAPGGQGGTPVLNALDWFNSWRLTVAIPLGPANASYVPYAWGDLRTNGGVCSNGATLLHTVVAQSF